MVECCLCEDLVGQEGTFTPPAYPDFEENRSLCAMCVAKIRVLEAVVKGRVGKEHPTKCLCRSCAAVDDKGHNGHCDKCGFVIDSHGYIGTPEQSCPVGAN